MIIFFNWVLLYFYWFPHTDQPRLKMQNIWVFVHVPKRSGHQSGLTFDRPRLQSGWTLETCRLYTWKGKIWGFSVLANPCAYTYIYIHIYIYIQHICSTYIYIHFQYCTFRTFSRQRVSLSKPWLTTAWLAEPNCLMTSWPSGSFFTCHPMTSPFFKWIVCRKIISKWWMFQWLFDYWMVYFPIRMHCM